MTTTTMDEHGHVRAAELDLPRETALTRVAVLAGRGLYALIFILAAPGHFSQQTIGYAAQHGVPLANLLVPAAGILALIGGLSVAVGYHARIGAILLIVFLVPVTLAIHNFWAVQDPMMRMGEQVNFMKNLSLLGAALLITWFGAGPLSVDAASRRGARASP